MFPRVVGLGGCLGTRVPRVDEAKRATYEPRGTPRRSTGYSVADWVAGADGGGAAWAGRAAAGAILARVHDCQCEPGAAHGAAPAPPASAFGSDSDSPRALRPSGVLLHAHVHLQMREWRRTHTLKERASFRALRMLVCFSAKRRFV